MHFTPSFGVVETLRLTRLARARVLHIGNTHEAPELLDGPIIGLIFANMLPYELGTVEIGGVHLHVFRTTIHRLMLSTWT